MKKISLNLFDARKRGGEREGEREKKRKKNGAKRGGERTGEGGRELSAFAAESG